MTQKQELILKSNEEKETKLKVAVYDQLNSCLEAIESKLKEFAIRIQDEAKS